MWSKWAAWSYLCRNVITSTRGTVKRRLVKYTETLLCNCVVDHFHDLQAEYDVYGLFAIYLFVSTNIFLWYFAQRFISSLPFALFSHVLDIIGLHFSHLVQHFGPKDNFIHLWTPLMFPF